MKMTIKAIALIAFFTVALAIGFDDFVSSDPIQYYSQRKSRLLIVALIGLLGAFAAFAVSKLSSRNRYRVKLYTLGIAACLSTVFACYIIFGFFTLLFQMGPSEIGLEGILRGFFFMPLMPISASIFLWLVFHQSFKLRVE
jgi:hypothetical protein